MSYAVAQRTQEIGVRLALGAAERQIFGLVVGESLKLAAVGLALGLAGSLARRAGASAAMLFGVGGADPRHVRRDGGAAGRGRVPGGLRARRAGPCASTRCRRCEPTET